MSQHDFRLPHSVSHAPDDLDGCPPGCPALITLKTRAGDQPLPTVNEHQDIQSLVLEDVEARRDLGIARYGTALQPNNGRDMLLDAYEEALDLAIYLKGVIVERQLAKGKPEGRGVGIERLRQKLVPPGSASAPRAMLGAAERAYDAGARA